MSMSIRSASPASSSAASRRRRCFPDGNAGLAYAMVKWADAFFRSGLHMAISLTSPGWPAEFRRDRQQLFPDVDFERIDLDHAKSQLRAHASFVDQQLADGRPFLLGAAPGLVDIHAWTVPWFARASMPVVNELLADLPRLAAWERRIAELGEGARSRKHTRGCVRSGA